MSEQTIDGVATQIREAMENAAAQGLYASIALGDIRLNVVYDGIKWHHWGQQGVDVLGWEAMAIEEFDECLNSRLNSFGDL